MILVFLLCLASLLSPPVPSAKTRASRIYAANHIAHPFPATNVLMLSFTNRPQLTLVSNSPYSFGTNTDPKRSIEEAERINAIQMQRRRVIDPTSSVRPQTQP